SCLHFSDHTSDFPFKNKTHPFCCSFPSQLFLLLIPSPVNRTRYFQKLRIPETGFHMVIDDPARLQMRINGNGTHVFHASLFQITAHLIRQPVPCRYLASLMSIIEVGFSLCEAPDVFAERSEFPPYLLKTAGIMYHSLYLPSGTDHPVRVQDTLDIIFAVLCHFIKVKIIKAGPENLPLLYHHIPVHTALHHFHHKKLELLLIIVKRDAPLLVVIPDHFVIACAPKTSVHPTRLLSTMFLITSATYPLFSFIDIPDISLLFLILFIV